MSRYFLFFTVLLFTQIYGLVAFHGWPWSVESKIDFSSIATFAAVIVALSVAIRDMVIRWSDRRHHAARFIAYHRPVMELILQRVAAASGVIEQQKSLRLGQARPYQSFKFASLVVKKDVWVDVNNVLQSLSALPLGQAKSISSILGLLPLLKSDFETLAMPNAGVAIGEGDQDLIASIVKRGHVIVTVLQEFLGLTKGELDILVKSYKEVIYDGKEALLVNGTA